MGGILYYPKRENLFIEVDYNPWIQKDELRPGTTSRWHEHIIG